MPLHEVAYLTQYKVVGISLVCLCHLAIEAVKIITEPAHKVSLAVVWFTFVGILHECHDGVEACELLF